MLQNKKPLNRTTPLKRKPWGHGGTNTKGDIKARCNAMWSALTKRPMRCYFADAKVGECHGRFEAAHIINRSQSARIMFHPHNGLCLCAKHHAEFDNKATGTAYHTLRNYLAIKEPARVRNLVEECRIKAPIKGYEWQLILSELQKVY